MQWLVSLFVLLFAACASARSAFGNKLLVVLDDVAEKEVYSTFLEDVKGEPVPFRARKRPNHDLMGRLAD